MADASDAKVGALEAQRASLFNSLPNLLDPRTPEGDDEESSGEIDARIVEIRPEAVVIDTNPPLAGKPIVLTAKVLGIGDPD